MATGRLISLSEENLVSCSYNGDMGCSGGEQSSAFCWTYHTGGLCTEERYPYTSGGGKDGQECHQNCAPAVTVGGYHAIPAGDEDALLKALQIGPVAIGLDASSTAFALYKKGIINTPSCGNQIDHAVLLVGYGTGTEGTEKGVKYWKVKNSWNKDWGEVRATTLAQFLIYKPLP